MFSFLLTSELSSMASPPATPHGALRRFLLLKYIQTLLLPLGNELLLAVGALASLHTLLLLSSPRLSRKATTVLLGQLAWADGLLLLRWSLGLEYSLGPGKVGLSLGGGVETVAWMKEGLLDAHHLASMLLLSCVSLEALLVSRWASESRHLRTVRSARHGSAIIWTGVALQLGVQLVGHWVQQLGAEVMVDGGGSNVADVGEWRLEWRVFMQICVTLLSPSLMCAVKQGLLALLWMMNTWVLFTVFYRRPQKKGKSCYH